MNDNAEQLPDDLDELKHIVAVLTRRDEEQRSEIRELANDKLRLEKETEILHDELTLLRQKLFGKSSERYNETELIQQSLFDEELGVTEGAETTIEVSPYTRK